MSLFVKLDETDPYDTFAVLLRRSRLAMERAYIAAFEAHNRCADLLKEHRWQNFSVSDPLGFPVFGLPKGWPPAEVSQADRDAMWLDALTEDFQADQQAAPVVLTADDMLRRFARGVFQKPLTLDAGFGPTFGTERVPLTALLNAATNTLRHVSEWDELRKPPFPYQPAESFDEVSNERRAINNINVLQKAFGIGISGPIREPVSMRVLVAVNARGTVDYSYERFEDAVIATAREMAKGKGPTPLRKLDEALRRQQKVLRKAGR
jgi:hypothetical protein